MLINRCHAKGLIPWAFEGFGACKISGPTKIPLAISWKKLGLGDQAEGSAWLVGEAERGRAWAHLLGLTKETEGAQFGAERM